jgi:hypothetical protein
MTLSDIAERPMMAAAAAIPGEALAPIIKKTPGAVKRAGVKPQGGGNQKRKFAVRLAERGVPGV